MEPFSAFLVIIKTNYGQIIGQFVDSEFESTKGMVWKNNRRKFSDGKLINNEIIYFFLDD